MARFISFLILVLISPMIVAQTEVSAGFRIGLNSSNITNSELESRTSLYAGGLVEFQFNSFYALQLEFNYSGQGGTKESPIPLTYPIDYLSNSIMNKFYLLNKTNFFIVAGGSLDVSLENFIFKSDEGSSGPYTNNDFSWSMGLGYEFDFGLTLETRFKRGLKSTDIYRYGVYAREGPNYNSVVQIGTGFKF